MNIEKSVYCPELKMHFDSIRQAARFLGITPSAISMCLNGKTPNAGKCTIDGLKVCLTWERT